MYSNVLNIIKSTAKEPSVCCNQWKVKHDEFIRLRDESCEKAAICDKIRNDFGDEFMEDAISEWKSVSSERDLAYKAMDVNGLFDEFMKDIIGEYGFEYVGNCRKGADGGNDTTHLWNHDNASCFKAKAKDAYILMEHRESIFNGHYFIDFDIHYVFSNEVECALLEWDLRNHEEYWRLSNEPNENNCIHLKYNQYEKAEYYYLQKRLKEKFEKFLAEHDIIQWEMEDKK